MIEIHFDKSWSHNSLRVFAFESQSRSTRAYRLTLSSYETTSEVHIDPAIEIPMKDALQVLKALRDALIEYGVLSAGSEAELKATKYHLEDMRKLALEDSK